MDTAVATERERCAGLADELAGRWEASANRMREKYKTRFFFGLGKSYVPTVIERSAKDIEAAAHGLRAVSLLIRNGAVKK